MSTMQACVALSVSNCMDICGDKCVEAMRRGSIWCGQVSLDVLILTISNVPSHPHREQLALTKSDRLFLSQRCTP